MTKYEEEKSNNQSQSHQSLWTTWEELLLSCAVKRYGLSDWSTVATELQSRASNHPIHNLFTSQICRNKFHDLKQRFSVTDAGDGEVVAGDTSVPWLDELKNLRIAELREIVEGRGVSIQRLNLKVKRLEEERERSGKEDETREHKPDLEENRSENDKTDIVLPAKDGNDDKVAGDSVSGERSDKGNMSVNESNSTEIRPTGEKAEKETMEFEPEIEPIQTVSVKKDDVEGKPVEADSWNDSSKPSEEKRVRNESAKVRDSAAGESKEGAKDSNEAQSSASLTKKSRSNNSSAGDSGGDIDGDEPMASGLGAKTTSRDSVKKIEQLIQFLNLIRSSKNGSVFETRLQIQKTEKYKSIIRQHVDLETVQARVTNGSYSSCTHKFYLDLLLLFNNAIVFFPKSSPESSSAFELRNLVLKRLNKKRTAKQSNPSPESAPSILVKAKSDPERSDPLRAKQKTSAPFIVCRKRSSITSKPSTSDRAQKQDDKPVLNTKQPPAKTSSSSPNEEESSLKLKLNEKPVRGARSMRRNSNIRTNNATNASAKKTTNTSDKNPMTDASTNPASSTIKGSEAPKAENKKKTDQLLLKKREAADFLKRIKKSSPGKGTILDAFNSSPENNNSSSRRENREQPKKKVDERKESTTGRQKGGGGGKRAKEEEVSPSKRNVGRPPKRGREGVVAPGKRGKEVVEEEVGAKRPNKRSKR